MALNWLLRLGAPGGQRSQSMRSRLTHRDQARHAILSWRLKRSYLIYSSACAAVVLVLLVWNIVKGVQNNWNLPQWKHHRWEEFLEVSIGVAKLCSTVGPSRKQQPIPFFGSCFLQNSG
eukprot:s1146_g3.t1